MKWLIRLLAIAAIVAPATSQAQRDTLSTARSRAECLLTYLPSFCDRTVAFTVNRVDSLALPKPNPGSLPNVPWAVQQQALEQHLFPPELIMQHQSQLGITAEQRTLITGEIGKLQTAVVQMQWGVADETQKLVEQLQRAVVSEQQALAQVDRLIALETAVKRAQLSMLIRIRNALTPQQVETLSRMRHRPGR